MRSPPNATHRGNYVRQSAARAGSIDGANRARAPQKKATRQAGLAIIWAKESVKKGLKIQPYGMREGISCTAAKSMVQRTSIPYLDGATRSDRDGHRGKDWRTCLRPLPASITSGSASAKHAA